MTTRRAWLFAMAALGLPTAWLPWHFELIVSDGTSRRVRVNAPRSVPARADEIIA